MPRPILLGTPKRRRGKVPWPIPPRGIEVSYTRFLLDMVAALHGLLLEALEPIAKAELAGRRTDAWTDALEMAIEWVTVRFAERFTPASVTQRVRATGKAVSDHTGRELNRQVKSVLGVDIFQSEPWLEEELAAFTRENARLIKSLTDEHARKVEALVSDAVRKGRSWEQLSGDLQAQLGVGKNRAKLIARDQIGKANGRITELRQRAIGIERYVWRTVGDRRVRGTPGGAFPDAHPSHYARDGKAFSWSEPPPGGHPGEAVRCRCTAEPDIPEIDDLFAD